MRVSGGSDIARWSEPLNLHRDWNERARLVAGLIEPPATVIDLGCGAMDIEGELAPGIVYLPADLVARDARTLIFDINAAQIPDVGADVAIALGLLEYVHDPARFFAALARWPRVILSYNPTDLDEGRDRLAHGWFNDLTSAALIGTALVAGFRLTKTLPLKKQRIYDFERLA